MISCLLVTNASYYMLYKKTVYIEYKDSDGNDLEDTVESTSGTAYTNYDLSSTIAGTAPKLSNKIPTKEGFEFLGWNTSENQSTATYSTTDCTNQKEITGQTEDLQLYAVWESAFNLKSDFDINVTVNFPTTAGITTWYPYAYDETNYYVIAGQYYNPSQGLPSGLSISSNSSYPYAVYISSNTGNAPSGSEISKSGFWRRYNLSITATYTTRFCQRLLDTSFWKSKFSSTYTDDAIGSPTAEMLKMAWEARGGNTITLTSGYYGYSTSGSVGTSDNAFNIGVVSGQSNSYYLASPGGGFTSGSYISGSSGSVLSAVTINDKENGIGLRPVVKLRSNYKITKSGSSYIIQSN